MASETWVFDPAYSSMTFRISHFGVSHVRGTFRSWRGRIELEDGNLDGSSVEVTIDSASVDTGDAARDADVRTSNFLDVERFPTIGFIGDEVQPVDSRQMRVAGLLTMHGVTRPVIVEVESRGRLSDDDGVERMAFGASARVSRKEFGLRWEPVLEATAGVFVGEHVDIEFGIEAVRDSDAG